MAALATVVLFGSGAAAAALADAPPVTTEPTTTVPTTTTATTTSTTTTKHGRRDYDEHGDDDHHCGDHEAGAADLDNYRLVTASEGDSYSRSPSWGECVRCAVRERASGASAS